MPPNDGRSQETSQPHLSLPRRDSVHGKRGEGCRKPLGPQAARERGPEPVASSRALALLTAPLGRSLASSAVPSTTVPWLEAGITHGPTPQDSRRCFWVKR